MNTKVDHISEPCCGNCRFSKMFKHDNGDLTLACNFDPPKVTAVAVPDPQRGIKWLTNTSFPPIMKELWCGKHERQKH